MLPQNRCTAHKHFISSQDSAQGISCHIMKSGESQENISNCCL